tara:strand:- start:413 stop:2224 length:1812 start_codon:yes stop_codon:yes gene_type:complete
MLSPILNAFIAAALLSTTITNTFAQVSKEEPESIQQKTQNVSLAKGKSVVVTANPFASKAAAAILEQGGTAVDAAIAAQAVLAVVEPQSSGLGGGTFLMYWDQPSRSLHALDGRETAPIGLQADVFLNSKNKPIPWIEATSKPNAIGVPGTVALLWTSHQRFGKLPWPELIKPAIKLARDGFKPSPRLVASVQLAKKIGVDHSQQFKDLYLPKGEHITEKNLFKNLALYNTLQTLANQGAKAFYQGVIAREIANKMKAISPKQDATLITLKDLSSYDVKERSPLCSQYKHWKICTFPPPSGGGVAILQTLKILEHFPLVQWGSANPKSLHTISEALKLTDADRNYWISDPNDFNTQTDLLLDKSYIEARKNLIKPNQILISPPHGVPDTNHHDAYRPQQKKFRDATTHLVIVDSEGNIANMTSSVETVFGSRYMAAGMILNNQLTDFSFSPEQDGLPIRNRARPKKRPLSSMAPTFVFQNGIPILAIGTPGGTTIPHYLSRTLISLLDWKLPASQAILMPHISVRQDLLFLEKINPTSQKYKAAINALTKTGHRVKRKKFSSGIALIKKDKHEWIGAADPRREGLSISITTIPTTKNQEPNSP